MSLIIRIERYVKAIARLNHFHIFNPLGTKFLENANFSYTNEFKISSFKCISPKALNRQRDLLGCEIDRQFYKPCITEDRSNFIWIHFLAERFGSGDGERKMLLTRQIAFEPLPASVLSGNVLARGMLLISVNKVRSKRRSPATLHVISPLIQATPMHIPELTAQFEILQNDVSLACIK